MTYVQVHSNVAQMLPQIGQSEMVPASRLTLVSACLASPPLPQSQQLRSLALRKHRAGALAVAGDEMDDYSVLVGIDGVDYHLNVDTGSALVGVAGNASIGCERHYAMGDRCGADIAVSYGSGFWTGRVCEGTVSLGPFAVDDYKFGAYERQRAMTTCAHTPVDDPTAPGRMTRPDLAMEGILGLSFQQKVNAGSPPLLEALFAAHGDAARVFGLQCCGYDAARRRGGGGSLDVGVLDESKHYGELRWVPVTPSAYWSVWMTSARVGGSEALPPDVAAVDAYGDGTPQTIVDSGTSGVLLPARAFDAATASLAAAAPALPAAFWAGAACVPESAFDPSALPPLTLTLAGAGPGDALDLVVPWRRLVVLVPASQYCLESPPRGGEDRWAYALGAVDEGRNAILGQALFEEYYVAHAYDGPWIGFAPIRGCGPTAVFEALEDRAAPVALAVVAFVLFFAAALAIQGYLPALRNLLGRCAARRPNAEDAYSPLTSRGHRASERTPPKAPRGSPADLAGAADAYGA